LSRSSILRFIARHALLGAALTATLAASTLTTMRVVLSARDVAVPPLVGRTVADAGEDAAERDLALRIEGRRHDSRIPAERVVAQSPRPGRPSSAPRRADLGQPGASPGERPPGRGPIRAHGGDHLEQSGVPLARVVEVDADAPRGSWWCSVRPPARPSSVRWRLAADQSRPPERELRDARPDRPPAEPALASLRAAGSPSSR